MPTKSPFGPRHRKQAKAMIAESNRRRRSVRIPDDPQVTMHVEPFAQPIVGSPQGDAFLSSQSWVTVPVKAVGTEHKGSGWKASDAAYFGSSVWDGVEPDRSHQRPGQTQAAGFTATVDNPDAKQPRNHDGKLHLPYKVRRNGRVIHVGTLPWDQVG